MIKIEDLPKYVGKEVFVKRYAIERHDFAYNMPEAVTITSVHISANGAKKIASIEAVWPNGIPMTFKCEEVFATKENCQRNCLVDLKGAIEHVKENLAKLEYVRKEWEK